MRKRGGERLRIPRGNGNWRSGCRKFTLKKLRKRFRIYRRERLKLEKGGLKVKPIWEGILVMMEKNLKNLRVLFSI